MKYPRYPAYKDSGVEWIGEIPEHWSVKRLKFASKIQFSNVDKHSFDSEMPVLLANYTDVYKNKFITTEMEFMEATANLNEIKKFHLEVGDILVTKDSETPDDIAIPALVKSTLPSLLCGYHLAMLRPNSHSLDSNYLFYLYSDKKFRGKYESEANGITRFGLSQESFSDTFICIPDISEQRTISLFLEEQTSKIDCLISKIQIMIKLLKEKRQAIITHAVTKGLDPNVPMKDSGVEWIGEIPKHWGLSTIDKGYEVTLGKMLQNLAADSHDEYLPYLRASNIQKSGIDFQDVKYMYFSPLEKKSLRLAMYDLLVVEGGDAGRSVMLDFEPESFIGFQNSLNRIRSKNSNNIFFLLYWLSFLKESGYIDAICNKATFMHLTLEKLRSTLSLYPPIQEQIDIAKYVLTNIKQIGFLILSQQKLIELLHEYKTSLITQAVTGKIDVRGFAVPTNSSSTET